MAYTNCKNHQYSRAIPTVRTYVANAQRVKSIETLPIPDSIYLICDSLTTSNLTWLISVRRQETVYSSAPTSVNRWKGGDDMGTKAPHWACGPRNKLYVCPYATLKVSLRCHSCLSSPSSKPSSCTDGRTELHRLPIWGYEIGHVTVTRTHDSPNRGILGVFFDHCASQRYVPMGHATSRNC